MLIASLPVFAKPDNFNLFSIFSSKLNQQVAIGLLSSTMSDLSGCNGD
ncbi:MAG: hypothetical protein IPI65_17780 [Bacteroidetes bacterium]|nr:hypothetical protein [Bacteroidota bacterium]